MLFAIACFLTALMVAVIILDAWKFLIPNWLVGLVILPYPLAIWLSPQPIDWLWGLAMFGILFVAGFIIFSLRWMGGGDVKLLAACGLWVGKAAVVDLLVYTALLGGVLSIVLLAGRPLAPWIFMKLGCTSIPRVLTMNQPLPYGLAIAGATTILIWNGRLFEL